MNNFEKHTSKTFDEGLDRVSSWFLEMGALAASQIAGSIDALVKYDVEAANEIMEQDRTINELERQIDEQLVLLVATRQPTAVDLRFIINMSKGVVDLERIGDEATKIARMARHFKNRDEWLVERLVECQSLGEQVQMMVTDAMDAFANNDANLAFDVMQTDALIDKQYQASIRLLKQNKDIDTADVIDLIWVLRAIERIGDHARNLAELVIYTGSGTNVRHVPYDRVQEAVDIASTPKL
ncbi:MAG: phosphate signaling complex protein PhoU [Moraxella sp.]|nr:phosphate signaling complex protein PhoU [Moraxella sp.]